MTMQIRNELSNSQFHMMSQIANLGPGEFTSSGAKERLYITPEEACERDIKPHGLTWPPGIPLGNDKVFPATQG